MKIQSIEISKIIQIENSRTVYKNIDLSELMFSMKKEGLLQPIGVSSIEGGKYEAIWGNRRILSAIKLGWVEIDAHVMEIKTDLDRDFIGLVENFKRQNTSVAEDARMFRSLMDRGLSVPEISARLDITTQRINTSLEVLDVIPADIHHKIVNTISGKGSRKGMIAASTAQAILTATRRSGLSRKQTRSLLNSASAGTLGIGQVSQIAPLIKTGHSISQALEIVSDMERVSFTVFVPQGTANKLEEKYEKKISEIFFDYLAGNKEFLIYKNRSIGSGVGNRGRLLFKLAGTRVDKPA